MVTRTLHLTSNVIESNGLISEIFIDVKVVQKNFDIHHLTLIILIYIISIFYLYSIYVSLYKSFSFGLILALQLLREKDLPTFLQRNSKLRRKGDV